MCTKCIQRIDSSIPNFHTSSNLKQSGQQHFKSFLASQAGCKCIRNYNDNDNTKSRNTITQEPLPSKLKPSQESDVDYTTENAPVQNLACSTTVNEPIGIEENNRVHSVYTSNASNRYIDSSLPKTLSLNKPIFKHKLPNDFFTTSSPPSPLSPIKFIGSKPNSLITSSHIRPTITTTQHNCLDERLEKLSNVQDHEGAPCFKNNVLPPSSQRLPNQRNLSKLNHNGNITYRLSLRDFEVKQTLGTGSSARVHLARCKINHKYYAIKAISKRDLMTQRQVEHAQNEREVLGLVSHPFLVKLWGTFQNETHVFLVMDYLPGGELFRLIRKNKKLTEDNAKFYAAEVILAINYLHNMDVVYRDLKPENILLDACGHVKITDFGFAKKVIGDRTWTVCGTPDYLAPEIIRAQGYTKAVDWWSLGVLIYEMIVGWPPFTAQNPIDQYQKILECDIEWPEDMSPEAKDVIQNLLKTKPSERFGNLDINDIKNHPWFKNIDFGQLLARQVDPPIVPDLKFDGDTQCFPSYEEMYVSYDMMQASKSYSDHFAYF